MCIKECRSLEDRSDIQQNSVDILVTEGLAHAWAGDDEQARVVLQRAYTLDTFLFTGEVINVVYIII